MLSQFEADGFSLIEGSVAESDLKQLELLLPARGGQAGLRLFANLGIEEWLGASAVKLAVDSILGQEGRPVRAILFDKATCANWSLDWHQDRTIAVRQRHDVPGFDIWTRKSGYIHVEPPFSIIESMVTARIHLDPAGDHNGALFVARGSHRRGRIPEAEISCVIEQSERVLCRAKRGDVWLYRTSILHGSGPSRTGATRRVLQVDFSAADLPTPLEWLGIGE